MIRLTRHDVLIPTAIILAGLILAVAIFVIRSREHALPAGGDISLVRAISTSDHMLGSPTAPVIIVEYNDIESSYGKGFHQTLEQLMTEYAPGGKVALVYRHFPLADQHASALVHAQAAECAASIAGPAMFWKFVTALQTAPITSSEAKAAFYTPYLTQLGINQTSFESCLSAGTFASRVYDDYTNGLIAGATGAPFTILLVSGQRPVPIQGALPYKAMKQVLDESLAKATQ